MLLVLYTTILQVKYLHPYVLKERNNNGYFSTNKSFQTVRAFIV